MRLPTVTEMPLALEPVAPDPFLGAPVAVAEQRHEPRIVRPKPPERA